MKKSEFAAAHMLADCILHLQQNNVKVVLSKANKVKSSDGSMCKGYWEDGDPDNLVFACSIKGNVENWIGTFAHEYCHFLQWLEKGELWTRYDNLDADIFINCFTNKPITQKDLDFYMDTARDIEADCEKRTIKLLKSYGVPIDYEEYIRGANIYIFYYTYLKTSRRWNNAPGLSIYEISEIRKLVKPQFYRSYSKIPKELFDAFIKYEPPVKKSKIIL